MICRAYREQEALGHVNNRNKNTFSTSSAYADRPGFSALNVSWVNLGVSVQKQYSKISTDTNHFGYTKRKPLYKLYHEALIRVY